MSPVWAWAQGGAIDILDTNPLIHLPLDETSGTTATDATGNGHNGTYENGVTLNVAGPAPGIPAVQFDGTDDAIAIASSTAFDLSEFSFAMWIYATAQLSTQMTLLSHTQSGPASDGWLTALHDYSGGLSAIRYSVINGAAAHLDSPRTLALSTWYYIIWRFDQINATDNDMDIWMGCAEFAHLDTTLDASTAHTAGIRLARRMIDGTFPFQGRMSQFTLWDRALTEAEMQSLCGGAAQAWQVI